MNPALVFICIAVAMMALVLVVLSVALWRGSHKGARLAAHQADAIHNPAQANAAVYRDQMADLDREFVMGNLNYDELKAARDELSQRLLTDIGPDDVVPVTLKPSPSALPKTVMWHKPWLAIGLLVLVVPVSSLLMYSVLGEPAALDPLALKQGVDSSAEVTPEKLTEMATALTRRLQDDPNSMEGWVMLGRVQRARGLFQASADAFGKALALSRDDNLSIERAEVLAQMNGGSFAGEPWSVIQRVLTGDPQHINALFLAGSASYSEMNFSTALRYWERARTVVPADSPDAPELDRAIAEARNKLSLPAVPAPAPSAPSAKVAAASSSISGRVTVAKELQDRVAPTDTVFVYATAVTGSRMPVAIMRTTADKLPLDFVLDDSSAMTPNAKLSGMDAVTVRVRISKSGQAVAQAGDYGVSQSPVKPGSQGLTLVVRDTLQTAP